MRTVRSATVAALLLAVAVNTQPGLASDTQSEVTCLAEALYFEARGEPYEGKRATAAVIFNRLRSSSYKGTVCGVTTHKKAFSYQSSPKLVKEKGAWLEHMTLAKIYYQDFKKDRFIDPTEGALYFHSIKIRPPFWTDQVRLEMTKVIGNHVYYRYRK